MKLKTMHTIKQWHNKNDIKTNLALRPLQLVVLRAKTYRRFGAENLNLQSKLSQPVGVSLSVCKAWYLPDVVLARPMCTVLLTKTWLASYNSPFEPTAC